MNDIKHDHKDMVVVIGPYDHAVCVTTADCYGVTLQKIFLGPGERYSFVGNQDDKIKVRKTRKMPARKDTRTWNQS